MLANTLRACALSTVALASGCAMNTATRSAAEPTVIRHKTPGSNFPIAAAVEVKADATTVYLSGRVPPVVDASKPRTDPAAYGGDTKGQTIATLDAIESQLKAMGLGLGDIVKMQVYLVGDPNKGGRMDFAGFMEGYTRYFGTPTQPELPARSVFQVAGLAVPAWYVEIEVVAVRQPTATPARP
jgi:enamine deaminase RidA (YjgF/YER057c/UK114 family)